MNVFRIAMRISILITLLTLAMGCTSADYKRIVYGIPQNTKLNVEFRSSPPGAILYHGTNNYGRCPLTLTWNLSPDQVRQGLAIISPPVALWPSGATNSVATITADLRKNGYRQQYTFLHPDKTGRRLEYDMLPFREVFLRLESDPSGAQVSYNGDAIGNTPTTICETVTMENFKGDTVALAPIALTWQSGASRTLTNLELRLNQGASHKLTIKRPDVPGLEIDTEYALRIEWEEKHAKNPPVITIIMKSDPSGATLYQQDINHGPCPVVLKYALTFEDFMAKRISLTGFTARWPSGAERNDDPIILSWDKDNLTEHTMIRPIEPPGCDIDVNYAIEQQKLMAELLKQQQEEQRHQQALALQKQQHEQTLRAEQQRAWAEMMYQQEVLRQQQQAASRAATENAINVFNQNLQNTIDRQLQYYLSTRPQYQSGIIYGPGGVYRYRGIRH